MSSCNMIFAVSCTILGQWINHSCSFLTNVTVLALFGQVKPYRKRWPKWIPREKEQNSERKSESGWGWCCLSGLCLVCNNDIAGPQGTNNSVCIKKSNAANVIPIRPYLWQLPCVSSTARNLWSFAKTLKIFMLNMWSIFYEKWISCLWNQ